MNDFAKGMEINEFDKRILYELDRDSRAPLSVLSKKLKKSKQFIDYHMGKLESEGIIAGYNAIIDASKLGFFTYRFYVKLKQINAGKEKDILDFLNHSKEVWTVAKLYGKWDYAFFVGAEKMKDLYSVWEKFNLRFKKNIKDYEMALYGKITNLNKRFFMDGNPVAIERTYGTSDKSRFDETDFRIIEILSKNARTSLVEISNKIKKSLNTTKRKMNELENKGIICGYKLDINLKPLNYTGYRVDLYLSSNKRKDEICKFCKSHKKIYLVVNPIGGADLELSFITKNLYELHDEIGALKELFGEDISHYEYFEFSNFTKITLTPD